MNLLQKGIQKMVSGLLSRKMIHIAVVDSEGSQPTSELAMINVTNVRKTISKFQKPQLLITIDGEETRVDL